MAAAEGGFSIIPNWVIRDSDLTKNELLVYIALLNRADAHGLAWPSISRIAKESRTSERTVQTTIKLLEDRGVVAKTVRPRKDGTNDSNMYRVAVFQRSAPTPTDTPTDTHSVTPGFTPGGGCSPNTPWVQPLRHPGAPVAGEEDPLEEDPLEEDMRSGLTTRHAFSFIESKNATTANQIDYLNDLHLHLNNAVPSPKLINEWKRLTPEQATTQIKRYLAVIPRNGMYQGPESGEATYGALSDQGREWADTGMVP